MKVHKKMFDRWKKYTERYLRDPEPLQARCGIHKPEDVLTPLTAWTIAWVIGIPQEAYHVGYNDNHIETALRRIFPNAWPKKK